VLLLLVLLELLLVEEPLLEPELLLVLAVRVTAALADCVGAATETAVTVTLGVEGRPLGAV
jgi:hypothetical protein